MLMSIGHSTHTAEKFVHLLKNGGVEVLVDVRSHPTSRWEQHRKEAYEEYLPKSRIAYLWMPELGGWTAKHMDRAKHFADNVVFRGGDVRHLPGRKTHGQTLGDRLTRYDPRIIDIWRQYAV